jgi:hypothetical protein
MVPRDIRKRLARAGIGVKLGGWANNQKKKKLEGLVLGLHLPFFFTLYIPVLLITKMNNNGSETPGGITSSADRMVGMEHSEVRYFTRYDVLTVFSEFGC